MEGWQEEWKGNVIKDFTIFGKWNTLHSQDIELSKKKLIKKKNYPRNYIVVLCYIFWLKEINKEKCYNTTFFRINPDYHAITDSNWITTNTLLFCLTNNNLTPKIYYKIIVKILWT